MTPIEQALRDAVRPREQSWSRSHVYEDSTTEEIQRRVRFNDLRWTSTHYTPELCDPIFTPIFTAILGSGGFTLFGTTITYASIASAIATTALTMGLSYLLAPKPPKPEDGRAPLTQPIPYRFWGVGECRLSGAMMLWESVGAWLISVQAVAAHKINAYKKYYLNDDQVTVVANSVQPIGDRYKGGRVQIYSRLGATPETAISEIVAFLGAQGIWTSAHRGDGQASLGMLCLTPPVKEFSSTFPYGKPALSVVAELALCWDYRNPAQSPTNPATWTWTKNSALILCWHECFNPFGSKRDYTKAILPVLDMWKEEADVCDELVPLAAGGTERRYECSGFDSTQNDPKAGTNAILASCDGWTCDRGDGALLFVAGKFREKYVATLTDADIVGHSIQYDVLPDEEINRLVPKFVYPATDYTTTDTDFFEDTAAQLIAGRVLPQEADFRWVTQWRQARRLGKREWLRTQQKIRGSLDIRLTGINAVYAPWVRLVTPNRLPALNGKVISNRRSTLAIMKGGFQMNFILMPPNIDAWTPATDEGAAPPIPIKPASEGVPQAQIDSVTAMISGGSVYIRVLLIDPNRADVKPVIFYRVKDTGAGSPGAWVEQQFPDAVPSAGLILVNTNPVPGDTVIQVQAAFVGSNGKYGDRSSPVLEITTVVDPVTPLALSSFSATGGLGRASMTFATVSDAHLDKIVIYRVPTGVTLDKSVHGKIEIGAAPGTTFTYVYGDASRTNMAVNGTFAADANWTKGAGWTIAGGVASHAAGSSSNIQQAQTFISNKVYRTAFDITAVSGGGSANIRLFGGTTQASGTPRLATGTWLERLTEPNQVTNNNQLLINGTATFAGSIDNVVCFEETAACAPQGVWDLYAFPANRSGVEGAGAAPVTVTII